MSKTAWSEYKLGPMTPTQTPHRSGPAGAGIRRGGCRAPAGARRQRTPAPAGAGPTVNAVWAEHEFMFTYFGHGTYYSCGGLDNKIEYILEELGARPEPGCGSAVSTARASSGCRRRASRWRFRPRRRRNCWRSSRRKSRSASWCEGPGQGDGGRRGDGAVPGRAPDRRVHGPAPRSHRGRRLRTVRAIAAAGAGAAGGARGTRSSLTCMPRTVAVRFGPPQARIAAREAAPRSPSPRRP